MFVGLTGALQVLNYLYCLTSLSREIMWPMSRGQVSASICYS